MYVSDRSIERVERMIGDFGAIGLQSHAAFLDGVNYLDLRTGTDTVSIANRGIPISRKMTGDILKIN